VIIKQIENWYVIQKNHFLSPIEQMRFFFLKLTLLFLIIITEREEKILAINQGDTLLKSYLF
jgi:hypothetical protein